MRLVLIDGLPGSGKSTLASDLGRAVGARVLYETDPLHPLHPVPTDTMGAAWADIHLRISPEEFASRSLEAWSRFLAESGDDEAVVVESFPFQSSVRVLLQMEAPRAIIGQYWSDWTALVGPHEPVLIYLLVDDVGRLLTDIAAHRGPEWTRYLLDAFEQMPYATSRGLTGWEAARTLLTAYSDLIDELIGAGNIRARTLEGRPTDYSDRLEAAVGYLRGSNG